MNVKISIGEIVDKAAILHIKKSRISDSEKLSNITKEYNYLAEVLSSIKIDSNSQSYIDLLDVNTKLWDIEEAIRDKERKKEFDEEFISIARSVYMLNDERAVIKKNICIAFESEFIEEKSYEKY
jgi:hypothetical protein